jgi:hypothetical protein
MSSDEYLRLVEGSLFSRCESSHVEFKAEFDGTSKGAWCEVLKDIIAMANSGGGLIFFGLKDDGTFANSNIDSLMAVDPADTVKKIEKYTSSSFSDFRIVAVKTAEGTLACFAIGATHIPIVFVKPGAYAVPGTTQQKTAFAQGTLYFRHGAKSEPANHEDLRLFVDREVERYRQRWIANIRMVAEAPIDADVIIQSAKEALPCFRTTPVRLTRDASAPVVRGLDPNDTHPYRQKEVIELLRSRFGLQVTGYELSQVCRHYGMRDRADACYVPRNSPAQYSEVFVEWVAEEHAKDQMFFAKARAAGRQAPKVSIPDNGQFAWLKQHMHENNVTISEMARRIKVSGSTMSRLWGGIYTGDVGKMCKRIEAYRNALDPLE